MITDIDIKIGDLVKPADTRGMLSIWPKNKVGLVAEVSADDVDGVRQIFVRWNSDSDWSLEYSDHVEIISEAR